MRSAVEMSHLFLRDALHPQALCVDATLGHGKDAQFFLEQGCSQVIAFEIQEDVLTDTIHRTYECFVLHYAAHGEQAHDRHVHPSIWPV